MNSEQEIDREANAGREIEVVEPGRADDLTQSDGKSLRLRWGLLANAQVEIKILDIFILPKLGSALKSCSFTLGANVLYPDEAGMIFK